MHSHTTGIRAVQYSLQSHGRLQAERLQELPGPVAGLALLPLLGRRSAAGLELVRARGRPDVLLIGLGGEILDKLQLPHRLHAYVLPITNCCHYILLQQRPCVHEEGRRLALSS